MSSDICRQTLDISHQQNMMISQFIAIYEIKIFHNFSYESYAIALPIVGTYILLLPISIISK